jgi:hypothetical protein
MPGGFVSLPADMNHYETVQNVGVLARISHTGE